MLIPNPPTDNLYKFVAVAGLIVFILGLMFPISEAIKAGRKVIPLETEVSVIEQSWLLMRERVDWLREDVATLEKEVEELESEASPERKAARAEEIKRASAELRQRHRSLREAIAEMDSEKCRCSGKLQEAGHELQLVRLFFRIGLLEAVAGAILAVLGFWLWYVRVQHPQDRALSSDAAQQREQASVHKEPEEHNDERT